MIKGRNIVPEADLSCSTSYSQGAKEEKKKKKAWGPQLYGSCLWKQVLEDLE